MKAKLEVGGTCENGHAIASEKDLVVTRFLRKNGTTRLGHRCRPCKAVHDDKSRNKGFKWYTILDKGFCRVGHEIRSETDVYRKSYSDGRVSLHCVQCHAITGSESQSPREQSRRGVVFSCGCQRHFDWPIPEVGQDVYCTYHNSAERVFRWVL